MNEVNLVAAISVAACLLGGCAASSDPGATGAPGSGAAVAAQAPASAASDATEQVAQKQECHRETPVGSNIPVTRCAPATTQLDRMNTAIGVTRLIGNVGGPSAGNH